MKELKKIFNILNKEQKIIVLREANRISEIVKSEQNVLDIKYDDDCKKWDLIENTCKNCGSIENVNIISQKLNTSTRQPHFIFQQPTHYSYTTQENITQCSKCGNQWKKRSLYDRWSFSALKIVDYRFVNIYTQNINNAFVYPSTFKKFNKPFENFYAESIYYYFDKRIKLKQLRKIYKSIHC